MVDIIICIVGILTSLFLGCVAIALIREAIVNCSFVGTDRGGAIIASICIAAISILLAVACVTTLCGNIEKCPDCNTNRNNENYCITCGHVYKEKNICVCGEKNKAKALYCQNCGRALKEETK